MPKALKRYVTCRDEFAARTGPALCGTFRLSVDREMAGLFGAVVARSADRAEE
jgi:hypothetical protein